MKQGNPLGLSGYGSVARHDKAVLAVIRDQFQHRSAIDFGVSDKRSRSFGTCIGAAGAVQNGAAGACARVGHAHTGFLASTPDRKLETVEVPYAKRSPAFGSFALAPSDVALRARVDDMRAEYLGSESHRNLTGSYGFSDAGVTLVASRQCRER